jgi:hypothetical protein
MRKRSIDLLSDSVPPRPARDPAQLLLDSDDVKWNTYIKLRLVAHPSLDKRQQEAIAHDYRMEDNELIIPMCLPVAFYFIKRYNFDLQDKIEPKRLQLCLTDLDEFNRECEAAKKRSKVLVATRMSSADKAATDLNRPITTGQPDG